MQESGVLLKGGRGGMGAMICEGRWNVVCMPLPSQIEHAWKHGDVLSEHCPLLKLRQTSLPLAVGAECLGLASCSPLRLSWLIWASKRDTLLQSGLHRDMSCRLSGAWPFQGLLKALE